MYTYERMVNYYETDRMGVTHHSNYIRYMEEARVAFLDSIGLGYDVLEANEIGSPVLEANCVYKHFSTFHDTLYVKVSMVEYTSVKFRIIYEMYNQDNVLVCEGYTRHCFMKGNKIVSLKRERKEMDDLLRSYID